MVRIAVLSDVHGNTLALAAVLAEIDRQRVDLTVNLGDIASGGVDPRGTFDLLRRRPEIITVRGNHERQVLTFAADRMSRSDRLAARLATPDDRVWLESLPVTAEPAPGVLAFHGSPADDLCYLTETVEPTGLREATDAEIVERLGETYGRHRVYLCGHTHLQRTRRLPDGSLVVNPGSVGWPAYDDDHPYPHLVEPGTPHARFTIVDDNEPFWTAVEFALEYDNEAAARSAEANDRPDVARALRTGRV
ncbi:metallophosphoesterase family protein [Nocardia crassostreae]|uniref:metallophosphoesterase family protein n=1 Tax=Nocardia crassostreae TaxID=53428 RepID=UPI000829F6E2|nr:metallophosphoesterase family protein [Nocardia crassostreae]